MEMENHLEKDDGCYDNAEAAFSDDEEELNSKGQGAPGIPQGHRIPTTLENSQLSAQFPQSPLAQELIPLGDPRFPPAREAVEEQIPKSKGFVPFPGHSQELRALFQPQIPTDLTQIPSGAIPGLAGHIPVGFPLCQRVFPALGNGHRPGMGQRM